MRFASAEAVEAYGAFSEVDFRADEAVGPVGGNAESPAEESDRVIVVGSAQEDYGSTRWGLKIEAPGRRERSPARGRFAANRGHLAEGADETSGLILERRQRREVESLPDLGLPAAVEVLDLALESGFSGRGEDRSYAEAEAHAGDAPQDIGMVLRAEETSVVIELDVVGQAEFAPMRNDVVHSGFGSYAALGPGDRKASEEGDAGEHIDEGTSFDGQAFYHVEAVEFCASGGEIWEIPALGRREVTEAAPAVESPSALQDASDRSEGRERGGPHGMQLPEDGRRSELSEVAAFHEIHAKVQDQIFDGLVAAIREARRDRGPIGEVRSVQAALAGSLAPQLDGAETDGKAPRHFTHREAAADHGDHVPPPLLERVFWLMSASSIDLFSLQGDGEALTLK